MQLTPVSFLAFTGAIPLTSNATPLIIWVAQLASGETPLVIHAAPLIVGEFPLISGISFSILCIIFFTLKPSYMANNKLISAKDEEFNSFQLSPRVSASGPCGSIVRINIQ